MIFNRFFSYLFFGLFFSTVLCKNMAYAQKNMVSAGGEGAGLGGSVSYSLGQIDFINTTGPGGSATQGLQQVYKLTLNLKAYLQGYYQSSGMMQAVMNNQGFSAPMNETDSVWVQLRMASTPYTLVHSTGGILKTDGTLTCIFLNATEGQPYYVVLKHRNTIETWSGSPIILTQAMTYNFSTTATAAFGSNQTEIEAGIWALYVGDINQDGVVDGLDYNDWETDNNNFGTGYLATDINGDGIVDGLDFLFWELNNNDFVGTIKP